MYYAGIGSRKTPEHICRFFNRLAVYLEKEGYILRSGGANGADTAFESGVKSPDNKEIFYAGDANTDCFELASRIHPAWDKCNAYVRKLHGRNCMQILGRNLDSPSEFVVCWTPNGNEVGGTRTAIVLAHTKEIPVFNLGTLGGIAKLIIKLEQLGFKSDHELLKFLNLISETDIL